LALGLRAATVCSAHFVHAPPALGRVHAGSLHRRTAAGLPAISAATAAGNESRNERRRAAAGLAEVAGLRPFVAAVPAPGTRALTLSTSDPAPVVGFAVTARRTWWGLAFFEAFVLLPVLLALLT
jgi:hypothetical protein